MKKSVKIFFIIALICILFIFNVKSYSTEISNENIVEDNNVENNTNLQEPGNNTEELPKVEEPKENEPETQEPEVSVPEEEPKPTEPEISETEQQKPPEVSVPEEPKIEQPTIDNSQKPQDSDTPQLPSDVQQLPTPEEPEKNESTRTETNTENSDDTVYYPVYEQEKSKNNNLKRLEITEMEIEPEFSKEITEYYLIVDLTVEELEIIALAEDPKATVNVYNNEELVEGENIIKIIVTAEDGTQKQYTIFVTKTDNAIAANANLKSLNIKGFEIYPAFKNKIYKYNLTIDEKITFVEVEAEAENENATIEISGNDNLVEGNNTITITVTAEDGVTKREYKINTFISIFNVVVEKENKMPAIIAITIGLTIVLTLIIYIIKAKKL